jgi:2,3-bisphosphoglycerate-independent phosphoglycerate mutase
MKYVVILGDGMADEAIKEIGNKTPLQVAVKPTIDNLTKKGEIGLVNTIPEGMNPGSDTANLSVMGYDPEIYYTGRSPLEAISMGINMKDNDISFRCNLVTLTEDEPYENKKIIDHSADEITTREAKELIGAISEELSNSYLSFYPGVSYRHALIWENGSTNVKLTPPHDILEQCILEYIPQGDNSNEIYEMMKKSYDILNNHPINIERKKKGLNPANSIWIWGEGKKPSLDSFKDKFNKKGTMISAVDLLKGIAIAAGMDSVDVENVTGNIHTNFDGKAEACIEAIEKGSDFVYVHLEAPDECGHRGELDNKIKSIELIDEKIVKPIVKALEEKGYDHRIMVLPDHPTPIAYRTHTSNPVPYMIYDSTKILNSNMIYNEVMAKESGNVCRKGHELMNYFLS